MNEMLAKNHFNFILNTIVVCAVGFVLPAFTAIGLLGLQMLLTMMGVECSGAWKIIWVLSWIGLITAPIVFIRYVTVIPEQKLSRLKLYLILFNLFEYVFIQAGLASLITNGQTLCYVSDGQNGLELVFTAWIGLPILFAFSLYFSKISMVEK